ncbi:uncharacterized protein GGS22DRAFT_196939 [Annulohypoxylon maeteangense]|uniref:uncharacterized protein n=1 Tax=Annulohypoxylon maeteangense TaxID=1927788 RepID=UPI002007E9FC|nr:uncharacterized protein GGS22DRAFT_196939 [Annulohypoxylon maeteangense]KAI0889392.1 hypothetical protein GGS22DRAFT_196939 [Annulohypoxylon maeteangense]
MSEQAKKKFMSAVEKTRAPADEKSAPAGIKIQSTTGGDNPKAGGSSFRPIAKGETNSSNYVPAEGPST